MGGRDEANDGKKRTITKAFAERYYLFLYAERLI